MSVIEIGDRLISTEDEISKLLRGVTETPQLYATNCMFYYLFSNRGTRSCTWIFWRWIR